jgi:predicted TIM-barrel fold metal-dependent hydrolase
MRTIALEEHFVTATLAHHGASTATLADPGFWRRVSARLLDHTEQRLSGMNDAGIELAVLSLNAPGIQAEPDPAVAVRAAKEVNDFLAGLVTEHPTRFAGFAALPLQDPHAAAEELERAVTQLGMRGALTNAHTHGRYLDDPSLRAVWERVEGLNVQRSRARGAGLADPVHQPAPAGTVVTRSGQRLHHCVLGDESLLPRLGAAGPLRSRHRAAGRPGLPGRPA